MRTSHWVTAVVSIVLAGPLPAEAHATGHELRAPGQCDKLKAKAEVEACKKCTLQTEKHHFHMDYPAKDRCRPDKGKP